MSAGGTEVEHIHSDNQRDAAKYFVDLPERFHAKREVPVSDPQEFMKLAIQVAKNSRDEDDRVHPMVGAVLVKEGKVLGTAFRNQEGKGDHAEFILLENYLKDETLAGATLYTTLEPCTSRKHPKQPCVERIASRRLAKVIVGMLDPNPDITGKGVQYLQEHGIEVVYFPGELHDQVREQNRKFADAFKYRAPESEEEKKRSHPAEGKLTQGKIPLSSEPESDLVVPEEGFRLQEWYVHLNRIYYRNNTAREDAWMFMHLVEILGGLSMVSSNKKKPGFDPIHYLAKAMAWWLTLCGKLPINNVEDLLWLKYPQHCPYCLQERHDEELCREIKRANRPPQWRDLITLGRVKQREMPGSIVEWQLLFRKIYPVSQVASIESIFARLMEEVGELAEAVRAMRVLPGYFLSEIADVFAWIMQIINTLEVRQEWPEGEMGKRITLRMISDYPGKCSKCGSQICRCPTVHPEDLPRIAHYPLSKIEDLGFRLEDYFLNSKQGESLFSW